MRADATPAAGEKEEEGAHGSKCRAERAAASWEGGRHQAGPGCLSATAERCNTCIGTPVATGEQPPGTGDERPTASAEASARLLARSIAQGPVLNAAKHTKPYAAGRRTVFRSGMQH
ncbi:hypothetical protein ON010_g14980 [Phytophthora cinnamomi]|nr:hypothetical protein ON010_g14980 [Phytophthora cinnamomi]